MMPPPGRAGIQLDARQPIQQRAARRGASIRDAAGRACRQHTSVIFSCEQKLKFPIFLLKKRRDISTLEVSIFLDIRIAVFTQQIVIMARILLRTNVDSNVFATNCIFPFLWNQEIENFNKNT